MQTCEQLKLQIRKMKPAVEKKKEHHKTREWGTFQRSRSDIPRLMGPRQCKGYGSETRPPRCPDTFFFVQHQPAGGASPLQARPASGCKQQAIPFPNRAENTSVTDSVSVSPQVHAEPHPSVGWLGGDWVMRVGPWRRISDLRGQRAHWLSLPPEDTVTEGHMQTGRWALASTRPHQHPDLPASSAEE